MRWTEEDYQNYLKDRKEVEPIQATRPPEPKIKKPNKYGNIRTKLDGMSFASGMEGKGYTVLATLLKAGMIAGFCMQPVFILLEGNDDERAITYKADYIVFHNGQIKPAGTYEVYDIKGHEHAAWKRTLKMFNIKYPEIDLQVVKKIQYKTPKWYQWKGKTQC
jgi:hypothetical protein